MAKNLLIIRILFLLLCAAGAWLLALVIPEWEGHRAVILTAGLLIGVLVVLVDVLIKGFSLRGLTALTFGLAVGALVSFLIGTSPLLETGDPQVVFLSRLALFVICMYLGAVIALRGKDEFNLVIPYVRFVPHGVDVPLIVVDDTALIDGRVARICETRFMSAALVIPAFVLAKIQALADSHDPVERAKGRRGLLMLNRLKEIKHLDVRLEESDLGRDRNPEAKLIFLANSLKAKLMTNDVNLAKMAEFHGLVWLNINELAKALLPEYVPGETLVVEMVKAGKEEGQGVGYLMDGTMVVVADGAGKIGREVVVEVASAIPSGNGKMVFATLRGDGRG